MTSLRLVRTPLSHAEQNTRHDARCSVILPLRLTTGSGEMIPAVVINVSPSGLLAIVDERASLTLPLPRGSHVDGEFFFDELEVSSLILKIVRVERRNHTQLALGCKFVNLPSSLAADIRKKINARLGKGNLHKSR